MSDNTEPLPAPALRGDRLLKLVADPPEGMHWTCAKCGGKSVGVPPANGLCAGCYRPWRPDSRELGRTDALRAIGVPARHLHPFVEPGPDGKQGGWPVNSEGVSCTEWQRLGWCLVLVGATGSGKSAIAAELLWRAMQAQRCSAAWIRAEDIANRVLSGNGSELDAVVSARLRVIDELGIGHDSPAAWSAVEAFICRLWEQETPTIITTNLSARDLLAKSAPMTDRLRDGITCRLDGASLRGRKT